MGRAVVLPPSLGVEVGGTGRWRGSGRGPWRGGGGPGDAAPGSGPARSPSPGSPRRWRSEAPPTGKATAFTWSHGLTRIRGFDIIYDDNDTLPEHCY